MKDEKTEVNQVCPYCNQIRTVYLTEEEFDNWLRYLDGGLLIQDMLPNVSNADRELLRGGMCGECWKKIFGNPPWEEDDDEDED